VPPSAVAKLMPVRADKYLVEKSGVAINPRRKSAFLDTYLWISYEFMD
jgi:hypothetical protein